MRVLQVVFGLMLAGCFTISTGRWISATHSDPRTSLELGKTTEAQAIAAFGDPGSISADMTRTGVRRTVSYRRSSAVFFRTEVKVQDLTLDFQNGVLVGYTYVDTAMPPRAIPEPNAIAQTRTKESALAMLGEPDGVILCSSDGNEECPNNHEKWMWHFAEAKLFEKSSITTVALTFAR